MTWLRWQFFIVILIQFFLAFKPTARAASLLIRNILIGWFLPYGKLDLNPIWLTNKRVVIPSQLGQWWNWQHVGNPNTLSLSRLPELLFIVMLERYNRNTLKLHYLNVKLYWGKLLLSRDPKDSSNSASISCLVDTLTISPPSSIGIIITLVWGLGIILVSYLVILFK